MNQQTQLVHIATIGVDKQTIKVLELVFQGPAKGAYVLVASPQQADAVIFDFDCFNAETQWNAYREKHPSLPTLLLSLQLKEMPGTVFVQKPLQIERILKGLTKLQTIQMEGTVQISPAKNTEKSNTRDIKLAAELAIEEKEKVIHEYCGYLEDIDPKNHDHVEKIYYEPSQYLQGIFEKAYRMSQEQNSGGIWVEGLSDPMILQSESNMLECVVGWNEHKLRTMTLIPLTKKLQLTTINLSEIKQLESKHSFVKLPLDNLLWKIALWTARGRIPRGTSLHHRVILSEWPNFTRLVVTPHALQITALWAARPCSLLETAQQLQIQQRYVFSLFSAMTALKLTTIDRNSHDSTPVFSKHVKRNLLQRILARLHNE